MSRLMMTLFSMIATTLMGVGVIIALTTGYVALKPILIAESPLEPLHAVAVRAIAARSGMSLRTGGLLMWGAASGQAGRTTRTSPDPDLAWCPRPARGPSHREDSHEVMLVRDGGQ